MHYLMSHCLADLFSEADSTSHLRNRNALFGDDQSQMRERRPADRHRTQRVTSCSSHRVNGGTVSSGVGSTSASNTLEPAPAASLGSAIMPPDDVNVVIPIGMGPNGVDVGLAAPSHAVS
jgi:hypothetical protein